jgi:hypothetical protein
MEHTCLHVADRRLCSSFCSIFVPSAVRDARRVPLCSLRSVLLLGYVRVFVKVQNGRVRSVDAHSFAVPECSARVPRRDARTFARTFRTLAE